MIYMIYINMWTSDDYISTTVLSALDSFSKERFNLAWGLIMKISMRD